MLAACQRDHLLHRRCNLENARLIFCLRHSILRNDAARTRMLAASYGIGGLQRITACCAPRYRGALPGAQQAFLPVALRDS